MRFLCAIHDRMRWVFPSIGHLFVYVSGLAASFAIVSDAAGTRKAFGGLKLAFEEHDPEAGLTLDDMSRATGLTGRGMSAGS